MGQWYSKIKRMSSVDPTVGENIQVEELNGLSSQEQVESIADNFAEIANLYEPLDKKDITLSLDDSKPCPIFEPLQIYNNIMKMKNKSSTVKDDLPWKIIVEFSVELSFPLSNIYNSGIQCGQWPDKWKFEYVQSLPP